ncbi:hypothetical protein [Methylorubrum aminovorans]
MSSRITVDTKILGSPSISTGTSLPPVPKPSGLSAVKGTAFQHCPILIYRQ